MNLSLPFIRRPVMTALLTVSIILFGVMAYRQLPVNDLPVVDYPVIQVNVAYPGASPQTMAANVATPLEKQFMQIPGLELVTSNSGQGSTSFVLQFDLDKSIDAAATDVQTAITQAAASLPVDLPSPPTFSKTNPNDFPIMFIGVGSDTLSEGKLYDYANTVIGQRISILAGVSRIMVFGVRTAVRVKADPSQMASRGISIDDLAAAIQAGTGYTGAGQLDGPQRTFLLNPLGQLENAKGYNDLIIRKVNDAPVYLKDVATAVDSLQDERQSRHFWVRDVHVPAAMQVIAVYRQSGSNAIEVAKSVRDVLPGIQAQLPTSITARLIYDRSLTIVHSVEDVQETLLIAFVLVVMVIFMFLGRAADTLIPSVALPLSLLLTLVVMRIFGYSLDNLSLMALTLAIGFLVDDAIVFLENTVRRMEQRGENATAAAVQSAKEISFTILSMTVSLAAVFIPLVFMPGLVGRIFREFAITIVVAIIASGIISLTLTPLMCARMLGQRGHGVRKTWVERVIGGVEHRVLAVYGRTLSWFLNHRWISAMTWLACLVLTVVYFQLVPKGFLPIGDSSFIRGVMIAQEGTSPEQMRQYQARVEEVIHANPAVDMTFTITSASGFLPGNTGFVLVWLKSRKDRPGRTPIQQVAGELSMAAMGQVPGVMVGLQPEPVLRISTGATSNTQGQFAYALSGVDPEEVYAVAGKLQAKLREFKGFRPPGVLSDMYLHTPNLNIQILREQAKSYGVSETRILNLLRNAFSQNYVYLIKRPQDQYQVILEVKDKGRAEPDNLGLLYIRSDDGQREVPLDAIARWEPILGPQSVNHINQFTSVTFNFNLLPGVPLQVATDFVEDSARQIVPASMRGSLQGEALTFKDTISSLLILMFLAIFVMYVILGILYESYLHPITVLSSLPVALVGGLATLYYFHATATLYAYIGMFMLMGIVKKNGIMIVDFAEQRVARGATAKQAIHDASMDRFRPIIMTTLAALMGAMPIVLGYGADGESRKPLGLVVVGGLLVSQFITLYVTPVIYLYLEDFQEKVLDKTSFFRSSHLYHSDIADAHLAKEPVPPPITRVDSARSPVMKVVDHVPTH